MQHAPNMATASRCYFPGLDLGWLAGQENLNLGRNGSIPTFLHAVCHATMAEAVHLVEMMWDANFARFCVNDATWQT